MSLETPKKLAILGDGGVSQFVRLDTLKDELVPLGWTVHTGYGKIDRNLLIGLDYVIISRPAHTGAIKMLRELSPNCMIIADVDDDFHSIPADHIGYSSIGPGNPSFLEQVVKSWELVDFITVSTPHMKECILSRVNKPIAIIRNGWSNKNPRWDNKARTYGTINIGWAGTPTHRTDFLIVKNVLVNIVREFRNVRVVIGGDEVIYDYFDELDEYQKMFVPSVPYTLYPYMLGFFDILVAPLLDTPFNRAKSEIKLVEAGVKRIPWIASPLPFYIEWEVGGEIAYNENDWKEALRGLIESFSLRTVTGENGRKKAEGREAGVILKDWVRVFGL